MYYISLCYHMSFVFCRRTYETPVEVMGKLMLFTLFMFSFPIFTFFAFKWYVFEAVFSYPGSVSSIYAAIPAIIAVNLVIASYIYMAWHSEPRENDSSTQQKKTE